MLYARLSMPAMLLALFVVNGAVRAQSMPSVQAPAAAKEEKTGVTILAPTDLGSAGADVDAQLTELMKQSDAQFLKDITLIGRGRGIAAPQGTLGQVVWYGIKATVKGEERKAGLSSPLKSSFMTSTSPVTKGVRVEASGDLNALKEAARKLLEGERPGDRKADAKSGDGTGKKEAQQAFRTAGSGDGSAGAAGGLPPYQPLSYPNESGSSGSSSAEVEIVTTEGCKPRVLLEQGVVYVQSKLVTMKDGVKVKESACTDSFESLPIQKSYAGCDYAVDIEQLKAWPQYRPFYVNANGEPVYVTDCIKDENTPTAIVKDRTACSPIINLEELVVSRAYELVYTSLTGGRVVVAGCRPDETDTLPVTATAEGCGYRHEMANNQSFQQMRKIYVDNGVSVAISSCEDTGAAVPHVLDTSACQPQIDYATKKVTPLARRMISTDVGMVAIAECAPSPELAMDLQSTLQGCERIFVHNIEGSESYLTERFYYEQAGTPSYVGACVAASAQPPLPHQLETTSWQNNDTARTALPVTRVYITWNTEMFEVSSAQVRPDAVAIPYTFVKSDTVPDVTGTYYEACSKYVPTNMSEVYTRPDGTQVAYAMGPGAPVGPTNACVTQSVEMAFGGTMGAGYDYYCWYKGRAIKRREDGATIYGAWVNPGGPGSPGTYMVHQAIYDGAGEMSYAGYIVGAGGAVAAEGYAGGKCYANATGGMIAGFQAGYGL